MLVLSRQFGQWIDITHRSGDAVEIRVIEDQSGDRVGKLEFRYDYSKFGVIEFTDGSCHVLHNRSLDGMTIRPENGSRYNADVALAFDDKDKYFAILRREAVKRSRS